MVFSKRDQSILAALQKFKPLYPDLREVLDFYENLYQVQFAFKSRIESSARTAYWGGREINSEILARGLPQITFEELGIETAPLRDLFRSIINLLIPYGGYTHEPDSDPLPEKIREQAREIFLGQGPLINPGSSDDLLRTASGFALAPYLQLACERILPRVSLDLWHREFCPVCGGRPAFAALISASSSRTLLCPRCFGEWTYDRIRCPFCKSTDSQTYYSSEDGRHRLYVCGACNRYLKTIDVREGGADLCLPVECIVTVSMDLAAQEKGLKAY